MIDKKDIIEKLLAQQKGITNENKELISFNGRILDSELIKV